LQRAREAGRSPDVSGGLADTRQGDQKHVAPVEAHDDSLSGPFEIDADGLGGDAQFEGHDLVAEVYLATKKRRGLRGEVGAARASRSSTHQPALAKRSVSSSVILDSARSNSRENGQSAWSKLQAALNGSTDAASAIEP
jgi:hypothetical protein